MPDIIYDLPEQEYFKLDAASNSLLSKVKRSPAHAKEAMDNPADPTPSMRLGSLMHTLVLEPEKFEERYHVASDTDPSAPRKQVVQDMIVAISEEKFSELFHVDEGDAPRKPTGATMTVAQCLIDGDQKKAEEHAEQLRGKDQLERAQEYAKHVVKIGSRTVVSQDELIQAKNYHAYLQHIGGKEVITEDILEAGKGMAESVLAHPAAAKLLAKGKAEVTITWEQQGVPCKARCDFINDLGYIVDLKSTTDASVNEFNRSIAKYGYHRQEAFYVDGYTAALGKPPKGFIFVCVENKPPYAVGVYALDMAGEEKGREEIADLLETYKLCKETGVWPAYSDKVEVIELPRWYA